MNTIPSTNSVNADTSPESVTKAFAGSPELQSISSSLDSMEEELESVNSVNTEALLEERMADIRERIEKYQDIMRSRPQDRPEDNPVIAILALLLNKCGKIGRTISCAITGTSGGNIPLAVRESLATELDSIQKQLKEIQEDKQRILDRSASADQSRSLSPELS